MGFSIIMRLALLPKYNALLFATTTSVLLITLFFGLRPKGYDFSNHARWLENRPGVHFARFGLLYASLDGQLTREYAASKSFSVAIALQPQSFNARRFQLILTITDGNDQTQFIIGQWKNSIIIMNGNDYSNRNNTWRIAKEIVRDPERETHLTLTTGTQGSKLYLDSELVWYRPDVTFSLPHSDNARLTLGNDVYGIHPWQGSIFGLAFYDHVLEQAAIRSHFDHWSSNRDITATTDPKPNLLYTLNRKIGITASEYAEGTTPPLIAAEVPFLEKISYRLPLPYSGTAESILKDSAMNLAGFIPLGLLFAACFVNLGKPKTESICYSVAICFCLSMGIEFLQTWMPSRSSQALDVILNTMGAFIGSYLFKHSTALRSDIFREYNSVKG